MSPETLKVEGKVDKVQGTLKYRGRCERIFPRSRGNLEEKHHVRIEARGAGESKSRNSIISRAQEVSREILTKRRVHRGT